MADETNRAVQAFDALRSQLEARSAQYQAALPSTIPAERFQRVVLTAVTQNPDLLQVHRGSLLLACMKAAQDGLLPDGREAALVVYRDKSKGKIAQYLAMVAGIRKLVLQSGEVAVFEQHIVHENDIFDVRFGDDPHIDHRPMISGERGRPVAVYSVATMKAGGYKSFDVMTMADVDKVRSVSRSGDSGPWKTWYEEMAKKTIAKRHAKMLPLSSEKAITPREDDRPGEIDELPARERLSLHNQLDRLAAGPGEADDGMDYIDIEADEEDGRGRKPKEGEPGWSTATDAPPGVEG
jgi:recombination protein RecT